MWKLNDQHSNESDESSSIYSGFRLQENAKKLRMQIRSDPLQSTLCVSKGKWKIENGKSH